MVSWKLVQKVKGVLEKERGITLKPWGGRVSICLIYPNSYHVGMSNLGLQTLYQCLNSEDDIVCERAFLPDPEDLQEYRKTQTPLFSLESQKPLSEFDILAFSLSFENDFINILTLFDLAHIPAESRLREEDYPLIIAGGIAVFLNPEPISDFFDLFVLGEGEEVIGEFLEGYRHSMRKGRIEKGDLLKKLGGIEGIYVPKFYHITYAEDGKIEAMDPEPGFPRQVKRRWISEMDQFPTQSTLFTPDTEFKEMVIVEVNRGCPRGCRFCAACFVYHPFRNRSLALLQSLSKEALSQENRIGLAGAAVSDYPYLLPLCQNILSHQGGISLASLRIDAVTSPLIRCLKEGGVRTVTIAPEAGSDRLRKILKKAYEEKEILETIDTLVENGISQIKSYFLIGLPFETEEDVKGIISLARKIQHQILFNRKSQSDRPDHGRERWKLILSVNPFVPKPATPFQWAPFEKVGELKKKLKMIQKGIREERNIEMIHDLPKWAYIQALLSRGDRKIGRILMNAHRHEGNWGRALRETNLNPDFYVYRTRDLYEVFPWDFIDHGIPKEKLKEEYLAAVKEGGVAI